MINPAALPDDTRYIYDYLYKDGERISDRSTYNNTASYDNTTTQFLRITYNNTDDIAGHYVHIAFAYIYYFSTPTCPDYDIIRSHYYLKKFQSSHSIGISDHMVSLLIRDPIHLYFIWCVYLRVQSQFQEPPPPPLTLSV